MSYPSRFVEFFGPCTWKALHSIAFNYSNDPNHPSPDEQKAALDLFGSLRYLIPCDKCRGHYSKYLEEHPVDADSRESLSKWVYDLHSDVNRRKHVKNISYEEVKNDYTGWDGKKMESFMAMPPQQRLKSLADPHFGRKIENHQHGTENFTGSMNFSYERIIGIIIVVAVLCIFFNYMYRSSNRDKNESQKVKN